MHDEEGSLGGPQHQMGVGPAVAAQDLVLEVGEDADRVPRMAGGTGGLRAAPGGGTGGGGGLVVMVVVLPVVQARRHLPPQHRLQLQRLAQLDEGVLIKKKKG